MELKQIEDKLKGLIANAEDILTDENKRKELIDKIASKTTKIDQISEQAKELPLLVDITRDYVNGDYKDIPIQSIAAITATVLYAINPSDLIPDAIPKIGLKDDIAAINLCLKVASKDLEDYKKWKEISK